MVLKDLFKKPQNKLEGETTEIKIPDELCCKCPSCGQMVLLCDLKENLQVCPYCSHHFPLGARERTGVACDEGSFEELFAGLRSKNPLSFPGYEEKLAAAIKKSGEDEAVICGKGRIGGMDAALFAMDGNFMMGSMGIVVGEKITMLFEYAAEKGLPVVSFCVSGGARMQEGIFSLMQMAKTSAAVRKHGEGGGFYISVLTNPTTGGVTASFAMEGDIIISEPGALIGFAGPRVIEQTIRQKLPDGFQRAEFLLEKGFLDDIVDRRKMADYLGRLLFLHKR
ncbi:MAG: acetyl-CoA carboxylase carboxyltransferase subunit beta [Clostridiales bacterium]|nr:acetyl-CoA carboxylase carboxyltransferase subunit beta [Clostridiales bacterium]